MNNDEIVKRLDDILRADRQGGIDKTIKLRDELKPRPEFLDGEIVYFSYKLESFNSSYMRAHDCERIENIPIHFIPWSGGDRPCSGLVVVKLRGGSNNAYPLYDVRRGECLTWNHHGDTTDIIGYHQIEDLENEK